jgi:hypothetical protein
MFCFSVDQPGGKRGRKERRDSERRRERERDGDRRGSAKKKKKSNGRQVKIRKISGYQCLINYDNHMSTKSHIKCLYRSKFTSPLSISYESPTPTPPPPLIVARKRPLVQSHIAWCYIVARLEAWPLRVEQHLQVILPCREANRHHRHSGIRLIHLPRW